MLRLALVLAVLMAGPAARAERVTLEGVEQPVTVHFDEFDIPHVYAASWPDAARALGYLHASARLWEMDMFRRQSTGRLAEVLGPEAVPGDVFMRRLSVERNCAAFWNDPSLPADFRAEIEAYCAGVNQRMTELAGDRLPQAFAMLGYRPAPWQPVDCLVMTKYMGWDQSGTEDDLWFGTMVEKLGAATVAELWPLDRPYEIPSVALQVDRDQLGAHGPTAATASLPGGMSETFERARRLMAAARLVPRSDSFGSNNWAVAGRRTASGKPLLASDPHLGFQLPSLWYAAHVSVAGENVAGAMFPGNPTFVIGHTDHHGWGITNMQADAVDYFIETVASDDPTQYEHRGERKPFERRQEQIAIRGADTQTIDVEATVHGIVVSREPGRAVTLAWTGLGTTREPLAFWRGQRAKSLAEFLRALDDLQVPALNICYADVEGNIALIPCGDLPLRAPGQGRVPLEGASGLADWTGMIPRARMPLAVNPVCGYVGSANGRPASIGYPFYLGWMWDDSYRTRRMHDLLALTEGATLDTMATMQYDAHDKCAERFLPVLLAAVAEVAANDATSQAAWKVLSDWDYVAVPESRAPALWLRWFQLYREAVWNDEWLARGIQQPGGSWGFSGNNRREPMLEVLEFLTREMPQSGWFDDRQTPEREMRDDIARRSFAAAVASIREQFGNDPAAWAWKNINTLRVRSMAQQEALVRTGGPVPGTAFTLNPGSNIGTVGGGASWRMIVDFAAPQTSRGVYPGGQSEDPASKHYDDLIPLWAAGRYAPLHMVGDAARLPETARQRTLEFVP